MGLRPQMAVKAAIASEEVSHVFWVEDISHGEVWVNKIVMGSF